MSDSNQHCQDRSSLLKRLAEDLVGPQSPDELLHARPSDVYLTGILWPRDVEADAESDDQLAVSGIANGESDTSEDDATPAIFTRRPSSAGVSFAVSTGMAEEPSIEIEVSFGRYWPAEQGTQSSESGGKRNLDSWQRVPQQGAVRLPLRSCTTREGMPPDMALNLRVVSGVAEGDRLVTVTMMNLAEHKREDGRSRLEEKTFFQTALTIRPVDPATFTRRPSRPTFADEDARIASLIYRDVHEYATGHTASAWWEPRVGRPTALGTTWIPTADVADVSTRGHRLFGPLIDATDVRPLSAEWLSTAKGCALAAAVEKLPDAYREWIEVQVRDAARIDSAFQDVVTENLNRCRAVEQRIRDGARLLGDDPLAGLAFRLANLAMYTQFRWSRGSEENLVWRPFQLGFVLLALPSLVCRDHPDRDVMDLLWFPTGGGKTEAYLTLVAFTAFYRRLRWKEAGTTALMRYTLRLLTTQQFARATAVMLACEAIRRGLISGLPEGVVAGEEPISIGLWVGGDATPNTFVDAAAALAGDVSKPSPEQVAYCPACRKRLAWSANRARNLVEVHCRSAGCLLNWGVEPLPVHTVDENVYASCPTLLIGTVDKFAQVVRKPEIGHLFGLDVSAPPDLVIQDELHLISGPLGTMVGLYETALDLMFERTNAGGSRTRTKVLGSTATIRRAESQVRALFDRSTSQFPPPGIDHADSGFAVVDDRRPGRKYAAVSTVGRSAKFTLQAISASLLQSASALLGDERKDPYWTLVEYFNSLRELGGAVVLMQDDVMDAIKLYADRRGEALREASSVEELTSRRTQSEILAMLQQLDERVEDGQALDVVLATNMLSVGVDIRRLALMLVNGQPKGTAEYIQATSRVGRDVAPGFIVSSLNNGKARDRSRFETFQSWHGALYRDVEATSVTPFAARARDRALHAVVVAAIRHLVGGLLDSPRLGDAHKQQVRALFDRIAERAARIDPDELEVREELRRRAQVWQLRQPTHYWNRYQPNRSLMQDAERAAALRATGRSSGEAWPTMNNMRSVEPTTPVRIVNALNPNPRGSPASASTSGADTNDDW